jgi:antitoxin component YwqK of YwqJK toxin-antitoxin module
MRKMILTAALLISGMVFAQHTEPKNEITGQMVKSTYYYDNGKVSQEGFYKDGKVHGKWVSYDINGNKTAIAEYTDGVKTGKWFFWNDGALSEVDYTDSRVASVKSWKEGAVVNRN